MYAKYQHEIFTQFKDWTAFDSKLLLNQLIGSKLMGLWFWKRIRYHNNVLPDVVKVGVQVEAVWKAGRVGNPIWSDNMLLQPSPGVRLPHYKNKTVGTRSLDNNLHELMATVRKRINTVPYQSRWLGRSCHSARGPPVAFCLPVYQNPLCSGAAGYLLLHSLPQTSPAKKSNDLLCSITANIPLVSLLVKRV